MRFTDVSLTTSLLLMKTFHLWIFSFLWISIHRRVIFVHSSSSDYSSLSEMNFSYKRSFFFLINFLFFFLQRKRVFNRLRDYWKLYSKWEKRWFLLWISEAVIFSLYANNLSFFNKIIVAHVQRRWCDKYKNHALTFVNLIFWWRICEFCFINEFNAFINRCFFIHCFLKWISAIKELFFLQLNSLFFSALTNV